MESWFSEHGWKILGIVVVTVVALQVAKYFIEHTIRKVVVRGGFDAKA